MTLVWSRKVFASPESEAIRCSQRPCSWRRVSSGCASALSPMRTSTALGHRRRSCLPRGSGRFPTLIEPPLPTHRGDQPRRRPSPGLAWGEDVGLGQRGRKLGSLFVLLIVGPDGLEVVELRHSGCKTAAGPAPHGGAPARAQPQSLALQMGPPRSCARPAPNASSGHQGRDGARININAVRVGACQPDHAGLPAVGQSLQGVVHRDVGLRGDKDPRVGVRGRRSARRAQQ